MEQVWNLMRVTGKCQMYHNGDFEQITDRTLVQTGKKKYLVAIATVKMTKKGKRKRNYETEYIQ